MVTRRAAGPGIARRHSGHAVRTDGLRHLQGTGTILRGCRRNISLRRRRAQFGTHTIALRGIQLALLAHYADIKLTRCAEPQRPVCADCRSCYANPAQDDAAFRALYQSFYTGTLDQLKEGAEGKLDSQILMSYHSKINKALRALSFKIESERQYGGTTYGLNLDKNLIRILR